MQKNKRQQHLLLTHLGDAIRNRRVDMGITQQELAATTELHRTYITDIEAGHRNISMLTYNKVTDALQCATSVPLVEAERSMARESASSPYGIEGGLSKESKSLHSSGRFCLDLDIVASELQVKTNMSKLQVAVESFARKHSTYPRNASELEEALRSQFPINPFTRMPEKPSIGIATNEEFATRFSCFLHPGEIEYSPINKGANYIIKGGGAGGTGLAGHSLGGTYVLSGNLRTNNQP
jgi:transcriptional regulator with XRE-family HTH domain